MKHECPEDWAVSFMFMPRAQMCVYKFPTRHLFMPLCQGWKEITIVICWKCNKPSNQDAQQSCKIHGISWLVTLQQLRYSYIQMCNVGSHATRYAVSAFTRQDINWAAKLWSMSSIKSQKFQQEMNKRSLFYCFVLLKGLISTQMRRQHIVPSNKGQCPNSWLGLICPQNVLLSPYWRKIGEKDISS